MNNEAVISLQSKVSLEELVDFLNIVDNEFTPSLSQRVCITEYARKLCDNAYIFWANYNDSHIGLCAVYMNQPPCAFVTTIVILKPYIGKGIGTRMLSEVVATARANNISKINLSVYAENENAIKFYKKNDFKIQSFENQWYQMSRNI